MVKHKIKKKMQWGSVVKQKAKKDMKDAKGWKNDE